MIMKSILLLISLFTILVAAAQDKPMGVFSNHADVGNPLVKGSTVYDKKNKSYTLKGGGYNIWFNRDEFQFAYKKLKGDFILTANFELLDTAKEGHRKTGWMIRESLADTAVHISAVAHGDGLTVLQWRVKPGMNMRDPEDEIFATGKNYRVIQLERSGNKISMRAAEKEGSPFIVIGEHEMKNLPDEVLAGVFVCSHNPAVAEQARIWNVRIDNKK